MTEIRVPWDNVSDTAYRVVAVHVASGERVQGGDLICSLETSKAVVDVAAEAPGFVYLAALTVGSLVEVGSLLAVTTDQPAADPLRLLAGAGSVPAVGVPGPTSFSREAERLLEERGVPRAAFAGRAFVRKQDVLAHLGEGPDAAPRRRRYGGSEVDPALFDAARARPELLRLRALLHDLRASLRERFDRHVPTGTLLADRFELARQLGLGDGASIYDEACLFGDVTVGPHTWIGAFTILDGARAPLAIGAHCSIGSGVHMYTHDTIQWALTGGAAEPTAAATTVGDRCFIAPLSIVGPGTAIGNGCFVAAGSFVQGRFPEHSMIQGNPARIVGRVERRGGQAVLRRFDEAETPPRGG